MRVLAACEESQAVAIETWKPIVQCAELYEVSNYGRVRSKERKLTYSDGRVRTYPSKILKTGLSMGYPFVNLCYGNKHHSVKVHCLVADAFLGERPHSFDICHTDGNKNNNKAENLKYGSRSENNLDNYRIHEKANKKQKLNPQKAREILKKLKEGKSQRQLAKEYSVSKSTIAAIKNGNLYAKTI